MKRTAEYYEKLAAKLPKDFQVQHRCMCEAYGMPCAEGPPIFFKKVKDGWKVGFKGGLKPSPFTDEDVARVVEQCKVATARLKKSDAKRDEGLRAAIEYLQDVDFGKPTEEGLTTLEKASAMVADLGIKPVDIDLAIRHFKTDPQQAKAFIYGPSGRGSNKGAIRDLQAMIEKQGVVASRKKEAVRYWYGTEEMIHGYMGIESIELPDEIQIPPELESKADNYLDTYKMVLWERAPEPDRFLDVVKSKVDDTLTDEVGAVIDIDNANVFRMERVWDAIDRVADEYAHEELFGAVGGVPEYVEMDNLFGKVFDAMAFELASQQKLDDWKTEDLVPYEVQQDMEKAASDAAAEVAISEWEDLEEDIMDAFNWAREYTQEQINDDLEELSEG